MEFLIEVPCPALEEPVYINIDPTNKVLVGVKPALLEMD